MATAAFISGTEASPESNLGGGGIPLSMGWPVLRPIPRTQFSSKKALASGDCYSCGELPNDMCNTRQLDGKVKLNMFTATMFAVGCISTVVFILWLCSWFENWVGR